MQLSAYDRCYPNTTSSIDTGYERFMHFLRPGTGFDYVLQNAPIILSAFGWLVDGSFGEEGAGGLWKDRPNAEDILNVIMSLDGESVALHAILESGHNATGD